ncbi:PIG-L deacetylase family protein [Luteimicrobium sp. DT211]|uniref:PIG-L deacetylase family protein n=1 Tax=Luteimicrobium sp. DT211 TaxID=3393412 RepID=UPI003CE9F28E
MLDLLQGAGKVMCVGAHPDDIELGAGGTLLMLADAGVELTFAVLSGDDTRRAEARTAATTVASSATVRFADLTDGRFPAAWDDAKRFLHALADEVGQPDLVIAPRLDDAHQDHRVVAELVKPVFRGANVLRYEIPKWDGDLGPVQLYLPLPDEVVQRKVELLQRSYPSQHGRGWWDEETFRSILRLRGIEAGTRYAEGFVADKVVLR